MFKIKQQTRNIQQCKTIFKTEHSTRMYNERNPLNRLCLFMKITLHFTLFMHVLARKEIANLDNLFPASYLTTQILQPNFVCQNCTESYKNASSF